MISPGSAEQRRVVLLDRLAGLLALGQVADHAHHALAGVDRPRRVPPREWIICRARATADHQRVVGTADALAFLAEEATRSMICSIWASWSSSRL